MQNGGKYKIYRSEVWGTGEPTYWDLIATIDAYNGGTPVTTWTDVDAQIYTGPRWLHYKIAAVDNTNLESLTSLVSKINGRVPKRIVKQENKDENILFNLEQNNPNPFNPSTTISYSLPQAGHVLLKVYDVLGREVAELVNSVKEKGNHNLVFDAGKYASGFYIYTIRVNDYYASKKMLLAK